MKALTIRQPWAWAVAHGGKHVENRSPGAVRWQPVLDLAIHAGSTWSPRGGSDDRVKVSWVQGSTHGLVGDLRPGMYPELDVDPLGPSMFVALVDLVDVHPDAACCRPWGESEYHHASGAVVRNVTHLVFDNVRPLSRPITFSRGRLGLWTVLPGFERGIRERVVA